MFLFDVCIYFSNKNLEIISIEDFANKKNSQIVRCGGLECFSFLSYRHGLHFKVLGKCVIGNEPMYVC